MSHYAFSFDWLGIAAMDRDPTNWKEVATDYSWQEQVDYCNEKKEKKYEVKKLTRYFITVSYFILNYHIKLFLFSLLYYYYYFYFLLKKFIASSSE